MKKIRYILEATLLYILFAVFKTMPIEAASNFGGWLGRNIGPRLAASRKALRNIERALPDFSAEQHQTAINGMWENLGRVMAEYPHLATIGKAHVEIENAEQFKSLKEQGRGVILFGGHFANWEITAPSILQQTGFEIDGTYRAPNNPWSDRLLSKARSLEGKLVAYPKSRIGGRQMLQAVKDARALGILIDQKYNEGVEAPFFGMPAMTNPVFVQLAQKYDCPLIPVRTERLENARFKITFYDPVDVFDENKEPLPAEKVIEKAHAHLEDWIREKPDQWLWLHRRWDSEKIKSN